MPQYLHSMKSLSHTHIHTSMHKQTVTTHCNYQLHCNMSISWIIQVLYEGAYHKSKGKMKMDLIIHICSSPKTDNALELYIHATSTPPWHGTYVQSQLKKPPLLFSFTQKLQAWQQRQLWRLCLQI